MNASVQQQVVSEAGLKDTVFSTYAKDFGISPNGIEFETLCRIRVSVIGQKDGTSTVEVSRRGETMGFRVNVLPYHVFVAVQEIYYDWQKDLHERGHNSTREECLRLRRRRFDTNPTGICPKLQ
jgi:hypothetical protein